MRFLQQRLNTGSQFVQTIRFRNDCFDSAGGRQGSAHEVSVNGEEHDRNPGQNAAENGGGFHSVHAWHREIHDNQVGPERFGFLNGVDAINGFSANLNTVILEKSSDYLADRIAVVNEQDLAEDRRRNWRGRGVGLGRLRHADLTGESILNNVSQRPEFVGLEEKVGYNLGGGLMKDYVFAGKAFCKVQYTGPCGIQVGDRFDPNSLTESVRSQDFIRLRLHEAPQ